MRKFNKYLLIAIVFYLFLVFSNISFANPQESTTGGKYSGKLENPLGSNSTITSVLQSIISYLLMIGAPIVGIMVLYGGFLILTAQDSPEKVKQGFDTIKWAVIGYIIVLCAWGIVAIIKEAIGVKP